MASLIIGYEYDIFISYRQKDNKHDGWVTEFVDNLKGELESTFKEEISVYFDINPHDGLLETHDVDESLKEKLKCLVFIPIISRTYCDPKSFAWDHEFKAFIDLASQDQFGLKVKLPNGNVASRVLPIRIYDLDTTDIKLCEAVLGGVMRGVEFIYSEPGVNRPLKPDDDEKINLNKTKYRNQINKVGNAIQEIISGLLTEPIELVKEKPHFKEPLEEVKKEERKEVQEKSTNRIKRKLLSGVAILAMLIIAGILAYPKIFKQDKLQKLRSSDGRISVEVMPFENMTNDSSAGNWQNWIRDNLITLLSNSEGLKLRHKDASIIINGSYIKEGPKIRLNAKLIDSQTEELVKSFQRDGTADNLLLLIDTLSLAIKDFLEISKLKKEGPFNLWNMLSATSSPDAYSYYTAAKRAFEKRDYPTVRNMLTQALAIDSNFYYAKILLIYSYGNVGIYDKAKELTLKLYEKKDQMSIPQKIYTDYMYSNLFETPYEVIKHLKQLEDIDNQVPNIFDLYGYTYNNLQQYDKAINALEHAQEIYDRWGSKPWWVINYSSLGFAYHKTGKYTKEKSLYNKAEKDFLDDPELIYRQAVLALSERDINIANEYIEKYKSIQKNNSASEEAILTNLAGIYSEAGILDKAEESHRKALALEPDSTDRMNSLAYFLIDKDRNVNEGLGLADILLKVSPENYNYLHTKGWGLYKQRKYEEARDILQISWDLRMKNAVYNHEAFLHLEEAKKAVANQKNK